MKKIQPKKLQRPSIKEAEEAVKILIRWAGDNPDREGLLETPNRVVRAYQDFFSGYDQDPTKLMGKVFDEVENYEDVVLVRDIRLESHCEHHMVPFIGVAHVAYLPDKRVVGISKIARLVDIFAKRLQTQETMTMQIANEIYNCLKPRGVAVLIDSKHECMSTRGVLKTGSSTITSAFLGEFKKNPALENRFFSMIKLAKLEC